MAAAPEIIPGETQAALRACIQKVATGPEYSKDLPFEEARLAMRHILAGADPVQTAVYLIALRMKRETDEENRGTLQAIREVMTTTTADVPEVIDVADPYDGHTRGLPVSPFLPAVFASLGLPAVSHGLEFVGPKFGITHRKVLREAGIDVDMTPQQVASLLADGAIGWGYVDQSKFCPELHGLVDLRTRIVKRPVLTTVEVLAGPVRGRERTHLMTGYVHKPYPRIYAMLSELAGFDSVAIIRGVEGGVIPSLKQPAVVNSHRSGGETVARDVAPGPLGIEQATRAVPLPEALVVSKASGTDDLDVDTAARAAAQAGMEALEGKHGPARDSLVYGAAIMLVHLERFPTLDSAAAAAREALDAGEALARFRAAKAS